MLKRIKRGLPPLLLGALLSPLTTACREVSMAPTQGARLGRLGNVEVSIPAAIMVSGVTYEGGSEWSSAGRGTSGPGRAIDHFDVALDRKTLKLERFTDASRLDEESYVVADVTRSGVPLTDEGIRRRHRDFVEGMMHRSIADERPWMGLRHAARDLPARFEIRGFQDNFFSDEPAVNITCNHNVQVVAPFADVSTCFEDFSLPRLQAAARAFIKKSDLPRWREIREALLTQLPEAVLRHDGDPGRSNPGS